MPQNTPAIAGFGVKELADGLKLVEWRPVRNTVQGDTQDRKAMGTMTLWGM